MSYELQSLERALRLLSLLAGASDLRLTDIADGLGGNQTTALRTLRVLEQHGYVKRTSDGLYRLGARLIELGAAAVESVDLPAELRPHMIALSQEFNATAHIGMLRDNMITVIDKVDPPDSPVRYSARGTRMPLHATAAGKAALALLAPEPLESLGLVEPLQPCTPHSARTLDQVRAAISETLARGFSTEREEYNLGFCCVGSAMSFGDELFTVSISGTTVPVDEMLRRGERLRSTVDAFRAGHGGAVLALGATAA